MSEEFLMPEAEPVLPAQPDLKAAKKHFSHLGFGILLILVVGTVAQVLTIALTEHFAPAFSEHPWGMWIPLFLPLYLIGMPAGMLLMKRLPAPRLARKPMKITHFLLTVLISICMMYGGNMVGIFVTSTIQSLLNLPAPNPVEALTGGTEILPRLVFVVLLGPFMEELVFRKLIIDRMAPYGEKTAVLLSALIFGLFHGNFSQFFYAFALGLVFGYLYLRTGMLRYSVVLHTFINFIGGIVGPALLEGIPEEILSGAAVDEKLLIQVLPALTNLLLYVLLMVGCAIAGLVILCVNRQKLLWRKAPLELPKSGRFKIVILNVGMIILLLSCLVLMILSLF